MHSNSWRHDSESAHDDQAITMRAIRGMWSRAPRATAGVLLSAILALTGAVNAQSQPSLESLDTQKAAATADPLAAIAERLRAAYPDHVAGYENGKLIWRDGSRLPLDDGRGVKLFGAWLAEPDIEDMLQRPYRSGALTTAPAPEDDPGRARNQDFFNKMYGDCSKGEVAAQLVDIVWLPRKHGRTLKVTRINGVADRLTAVSRALDALPASFDRFLIPSAGTYVCRQIAGTVRSSAHGYGIAIDIATRESDYWRWPRPGNGAQTWRNKIPMEIVAIFEAHGFIWGGKWHHFDTMHFEYRPELNPPTAPLQ